MQNCNLTHIILYVFAWNHLSQHCFTVLENRVLKKIMQIQKYNHNIYNLCYSPNIISGQIRTSWWKEKQWTTNLEIRAKVFGNKGTVTLWQHHDLLLNIFNFIFSLFKIYYFNCYHLLCSVVDTLEYFAKRSFTDPFLFSEDQFRVHLLEQTQRQCYSTI